MYMSSPLFKHNYRKSCHYNITSGSDSSESKDCKDLFPQAAENAARNCASTDDPIDDEPQEQTDAKQKVRKINTFKEFWNTKFKMSEI